MNPESFKNSNGKITGLSITNGDDEDLSAYFDEPSFASDNKTLVILPLCHADDTTDNTTDYTKFLLPPDESKSSLTIKVNYTFVDVKDEDGLSFTENGTHNYKINKNFNKQEEVTVIVQNPVSSYGSFLSAGEKSCIVGFGFEIEFTLNTESYIFECFEAVSKNDGESRADCVAYENTQYDKETGVCRAKVRVLKAASDILIRPKCTLIENAEVTITQSEKGTKTISPADGTKVQSFIERWYSVRFSPDEEYYEFIRWKLYDINTDEEIPNGTYVTLKDPTQPSTSYEVTKVPDTGIELALRPVVAERPQIISNTPQNSGILKDSSIQVLFDRDMDENSIYYTEAEVIALRQSGVEDSSFLPALTEGELSGNLKNHYGYIKNGLTYYKNISLTNKKTGENLNDKFEAPVFEDKSTLTIAASKEEGKIIDDYTQVLVTLEKDFFYSEKIDETTSKPVTLRGITKWSYQVTNHGDEDALVFQKKNGNDVFTLKLNEEAEQSLVVGTAHPEIGNDGKGIESLNFLKLKTKDDSIEEIEVGKTILYCNMALQDVAGGSGPNSKFTVHYERIKEADYKDVESGTYVNDSFDVNYSTTTSEDAIFTGYFALDLPFDGSYRIWFDFTDRSKNHFYYPANANVEDSTEGFYVTKDVSSVSEPSNIIVESGAEKYEYKLSWADPQDIDYDHTVITVVTGETETSNTVNKVEDPEATINNILPNQSYVISITHYDYAGNKISSFPKFLTGFSVSGTPSFSIADNIFFKDDTVDSYNLTATAFYSDGSNQDVSSEIIISFDVQNTKENLTFKYTKGSVTKTATVSGTFYVASSGAKPTEKPVKLTNYSGTLSGGTYYKFGDFPQTIAKSAVTFSDAPVYKGWYLGSDGYFYAKCTENAFQVKTEYSNGTTAKTYSDHSEKYFKVEPIKWRFLTDNYDIDGADGDATGALLLAESILTGNVAYYDYYNVNRTIKEKTEEKTVYPNNYEHSKIRAYLNGLGYAVKSSDSAEQTTDSTYNGKGFLQTAFTSSAQALIATTKVDNSAASTNPAVDSNQFNSGTNDYACDNTEDKVFLLSEKEATTEDYGFTEYNVSGEGNSRIRVTTDYAKANYAHGMYHYGYSWYAGWWWLHSPYYDKSNYARYTYSDGSVTGSYDVKLEIVGVVPALCISAE